MATVNGGPLSFEAVIDDTDFIRGIEQMTEKAARFAEQQNRATELGVAQQREYARLLLETGSAFRNLDQSTQQQVARMNALQTEMKRLSQTQQYLNNEFQAGRISADVYQRALNGLVAKERDLTSELAIVGRALTENDAVMRSSSGSISQLIARIGLLRKSYEDLSEADRTDLNIGGGMLKDIQALEAELEKVRETMRTMPEFKLGSIAQKQADLQKLKRDYEELSEIDRRNANIGGAMRKNIQALEKDVEELNAEFNRTESFAKKAALAAGAYFSLSTATDFIKQVATVRGEFQQLEISIQTILRDKQRADALMKDVVAFAATTPFNLTDVGQGVKQLLAYGIEAEKVVDTMRMLGDVAAGVSAPINEIVYAFGTLKTQGQAQWQDIMQFTGRGIPLIKELADQYGVAESEIKGMVAAGKVGFDDVNKAMQAMTSSSGIFFNLMEKQSQSVTGLVSNLGDAWDKMLNSIGQSNEGLMSGSLRGAITLVENYEKVLDIIKALIIVYGSYRAALLVEIALKKASALATSGMTAAETLHYTALVAKTAAQRAYNAVLLASPVMAYTALIAALSVAIYSLVQATNAAEASQKRFADIQASGNVEAGKERSRIEQLVAIIKSEVASREQKAAAMEKLKASTKGMLEGYSQEEIAAGKAQGAIDKYIKSVEGAVKARAAFEELNKINEQIAELDAKGIGAIGTMDRLAQSLKNTFAPKDLTLKDWFKGLVDGEASNENIVKQAKASLEKQRNDLLKHYNKALTEQITGVEQEQAETEKVKLPRTVAVIDAEIKKLKEQQSEVSTTREEWKKYAADIKKLEDEKNRITGEMLKADKKYADERRKVLKMIADAEAELFLNNFSDNDRKIMEARAKYEELRKLAREAGLAAGSINRIDNLERQAIGTLVYEEETKTLQEELEKQKELWKGYEDYRKEYGEKAANERYATELDLNKTYLTRLQEELEGLRDKTPEALTGAEEKRRAELLKQEEIELKRLRNNAFDENVRNFKKLEEATRTSAAERIRIEKQYNKDLALLEKNLSGAGQEEELRIRKEGLERRKEMELEAAKQIAFEETSFYRETVREITFMTRDELKERVRELRKILNDPNLSPVERKTAQDALGQAQGYLNETNKVAQDVKKMQEYSAMAAGSFKQMADAVKGMNPGLATVLNSMSEIFGITTQAAGAVGSFAMGDIVGGISQSVGAIAGLIKMFDESAIRQQQAEEHRRLAMEQTTRTLEEMNRVLANQAELIEKSLGTDKLDAFRRQIALLTADLQRTVDKINDLNLGVANIGRDGRLQGFRDFEASLKKINDLITAADGTGRPSRGQRGQTPEQEVLETIEEVLAENRKQIEQIYKLLEEGALVGDVDQLKALLETYEQLEDQLYDFKKQLQEVLTGISFDAVVDKIVEMFAQGKVAAEDFAKTFQQLMEAAIIQSFRRNVLEQKLAEFYDAFAAAADSDNQLTEEEIATLQDMYNAILENAQKQFEELQKVAGITIGKQEGGATEDKNALAGAIRGMTEQQAELLAGQFNALRLHVAEILELKRREGVSDPVIVSLLAQQAMMQEQNRIALQTLQIQMKIEANTAAAALYTEQTVQRLVEILSLNAEQTRALRDINNKTVNWRETLTANGWK